MSTIDAAGNLHDRAGRFDGHIQVEGDTALLDANTTLAGSPLAGQTPSEIDAALAKASAERARVEAQAESRWDRLHYLVGDRQRYERGHRLGWGLTREELTEKLTAIETSGEYPAPEVVRIRTIELEPLYARKATLDFDIDAFNTEFRERGGWPRAFLVDNPDGHVHSSSYCPTLNRGRQDTRLQWMTDYSGSSEEEIVEAAGWRACTVCYPSAPVGDERSLPTRMFGEQELKAKADREQRAAAKLERDRVRLEKALTEDGSEFIVPTDVQVPNSRHQSTERFKTEQAAMQWAVGHAIDTRYLGYGANRPATWAVRDASVAQILEAVARKHGQSIEQVRADYEKKVLAKAKRDGWLG